MTGISDRPELVAYNDVRWACAQCGRFISENVIREEDRMDPGAYYGISTTTEYDCGKCGTVNREPALCVTATRYMTVPQS